MAIPKVPLLAHCLKMNYAHSCLANITLVLVSLPCFPGRKELAYPEQSGQPLWRERRDSRQHTGPVPGIVAVGPH